MRLRSPIRLIVFLLMAAVNLFGSGSREAKRDHLRMLRSGTLRPQSFTPFDRAYLDTLEILHGAGTCSDFFYGAGSERVLEKLFIQIQTARISDTRIGMRMSGTVSYFQDMQAGLSYRLFAKVELNTEGPFFKSTMFPAQPFVPAVGNFAANTRAARTLIVLHELAHLIQGKDGDWLIPDDGERPQLSGQNTLTIEAKCEQQIREIVKEKQ